MNVIQDIFISFIERNAVFFHTWGTLLILLGFLLFLILIYVLNRMIKSFRPRIIVTIFLIFPMLFLTLLTFLLTSPLNSYIATLSTVESSVGKPVPGFEFLNLHDNTIYNINEFHGKVLILNYWATGCVKCENELLNLEKLESSQPDRLAVISISHDPVNSVRDFIQNHPSPPLTGVCPGEQWIDPGSHLPFNILIDKSGIIRGFFYGKDDFRNLTKACNKYLNQSRQ